MTATATKTPTQPLQRLLNNYSVEVVTKDQKGRDSAGTVLRPGVEVFVANLPTETPDSLVETCVQLRKAGLTPVPHIVSRNIRTAAGFENTMRRLSEEAGVTTCMVLGGDRDEAAGPYSQALQVIESGVMQKNGVKKIGIATHPEGHPRVPDEIMWPALAPKLEAARKSGLETFLVSQFTFDPAPHIALAERLRADGITAPLRVGVAGPAQRTTLIKYALMCGVGASLRALRERQDMAANMMTGETPEDLLRTVADAQEANPALGIDSVHFFTFGSIPRSVDFAEALRA